MAHCMVVATTDHPTTSVELKFYLMVPSTLFTSRIICLICVLNVCKCLSKVTLKSFPLEQYKFDVLHYLDKIVLIRCLMGQCSLGKVLR